MAEPKLACAGLRGFYVEEDDMTSLAHAALSEPLCLSLKAPKSEGTYPANKIRKRPVLISGSTDLSREGVGLGVPVAKFAQRPRKIQQDLAFCIRSSEPAAFLFVKE